MRGEAQAGVVMHIIGVMARMRRFTVGALALEAELHRDTVRAAVCIAESRGWVSVDGWGKRISRGDGRGRVPVAYRWNGIPDA